jgi:phosphatidate cytidylyltransferase
LFFLPNPWWSAVLLPVFAIAAWEWGGLAGLGRGGRWAYCLFVLVSIAAVWLARPLETWIYWAAGAFWVVAAPLWMARHWRTRSAPVLAVTGWIVLVPAWLALAGLQAEPGRLLTLLGIIWLSDTAAYLAGRAWGRHKMAPGISPGKTWEGLAGAGAAVAVYYVAVSLVAPDWNGWQGVGGAMLFAAVAVMGVLGDLFESWVKRQAAVKDSGSLLPGHGGILDRIDSMTAALPVAALLLAVAT